MKRRLAASVLALAVGTGCVVKGDEAYFDRAQAAFRQGDMAGAARDLLPLAEKGHAPSQYLLGRLYTMGEGLPQDPDRATAWYRAAAEQNHADAQHALAHVYLHGTGDIDRNIREAAFWFRLAAQQEHPSAQHDLGMLALSGELGSVDVVGAYKWLRLSLRGLTGREREQVLYHLDLMSDFMTAAQVAEGERLAGAWVASKKSRP